MAPAGCLSELCALFAFGALSKANSEIKAHKFILANCRNKRKKNESNKESQMVREPSRYLLGVLTELLAWLSVNKMHICLVALLPQKITNNFAVNSFLT